MNFRAWPVSMHSTKAISSAPAHDGVGDACAAASCGASPGPGRAQAWKASLAAWPRRVDIGRPCRARPGRAASASIGRDGLEPGAVHGRNGLRRRSWLSTPSASKLRQRDSACRRWPGRLVFELRTYRMGSLHWPRRRGWMALLLPAQSPWRRSRGSPATGRNAAWRRGGRDGRQRRRTSRSPVRFFGSRGAARGRCGSTMSTKANCRGAGRRWRSAAQASAGTRTAADLEQAGRDGSPCDSAAHRPCAMSARPSRLAEYSMVKCGIVVPLPVIFLVAQAK